MLDCNKAEGRIYIGHQHKCLRMFCSSKNLKCATTDDTSAADIDAVFFRDHIVGVGEVKTRNISLNQLKRFGSYMVSDYKLDKIATISNSFKCTGILIVYLIPDKKVVWWRVSDKCGRILVNAKKITKQLNDNGKIEMQNLALIPLDEMSVV